MSDPDSVKSYLKDEFHAAYDEFRAAHARGDDDEIWNLHYNGGDLRDGTRSPFVLLSSSDETYYCITNGYFNDTIFNDAFHALDTGDKIDFIDEWTEHYDQQM